MYVYISNPKNTTRKLLQLINFLSNVARKNTNDRYTKKEIRETIHQKKCLEVTKQVSERHAWCLLVCLQCLRFSLLSLVLCCWGLSLRFLFEFLSFWFPYFPSVLDFFMDSIFIFMPWDVFISSHWFYSKNSLMDLFISSLRSSSIFIMALLKSSSFASAVFHVSGPTVERLLHSSGDILSWCLLIVFLHWSLSIWVWNGYNC